MKWELKDTSITSKPWATLFAVILHVNAVMSEQVPSLTLLVGRCTIVIFNMDHSGNQDAAHYIKWSAIDERTCRPDERRERGREKNHKGVDRRDGWLEKCLHWKLYIPKDDRIIRIEVGGQWGSPTCRGVGTLRKYLSKVSLRSQTLLVTTCVRSGSKDSSLCPLHTLSFYFLLPPSLILSHLPSYKRVLFRLVTFHFFQGSRGDGATKWRC